MQRALFRSALLVLLASVALADEREALDHFERRVRPLLVETCQECHGAKKQESDLRLDSRDSLLKGGVSGPAVVPGDPAKSLLVAAIRHEGDIHMPPDGKLTAAQIDAIAQWVKSGAPWPAESIAHSPSEDPRRSHWAFQPIRDPPVPVVEGNTSSNPIDAFIRDRLKEAGLQPSPPADRRTLIRRASYGLTGLPPTQDDLDALLATSRESDKWEQQYAAYIDKLLASPHYGEHWARHWLDVARYSDTKGYVYAREQRTWVHAWVYRDWVVQALNDDLPYDRFLVLQIAADQAAPEEPQHLAAMGFLTLGRRFLGVQREIIDDRIDVLTRGTMGLTVACARCHDHKYDPIPTRDYYSLYGVLQSCVERLAPVGQPPAGDKDYERFAAELAKRQQKLADTLAARRSDVAGRNRARARDYLAAQLELDKYPFEGFDQILEKTDLLPLFVRRWEQYLHEAAGRRDPVFAAWHAYAALAPGEFADQAAEATQQLAGRPADEVHPLVAERFQQPPASMAEVAARYGKLLAEIEQQWQQALQTAAEKNEPPPARLADDAAEALRLVLYSPAGPCEVPDEPIVNIEYYFDSASCDELWKLQNEVDNWIMQGPPAGRHAAILTDRETPARPRVFRRGNPATRGDEVPRQFVEVVAGDGRQPFERGSGRLELAQAIVDPANPLTARVVVNRVWLHHFGAGLVRTPSDFGTRAESPSHPELLDWLASRLIEDGWSLKGLHRRIVLSETYRQASRSEQTEDGGRETGDGGRGGSVPSPQPLAPSPSSLDPENRLLARMNVRRLSLEELRDSLLAATGKLDRTLGGRPGDMFSPQFTRRTLYGTIDRQFLPSALRVFDFANPDLHVPQRSDTTVPQQALFFLNHPLILAHAQALAARSGDAPSQEERVRLMFRRAYQRPPTDEQLRAALALVEMAEEDHESDVSPTAGAWQYGFGGYDEQSQRVTGFERLPHFTGTAWQGGASYPDGQLGWVQLTAAGGHPGNDLAHAAVRRWTAPRAMTIQIASTLIHEPKEGEGVRGFVVSSRGGLLAHAAVHHGQSELNVESLEVQEGETIDFVADIGNKLSHNQFLWQAAITVADAAAADDAPGALYDSQRDFEHQNIQRLTPWEQLAQVLLSANEFVFVD